MQQGHPLAFISKALGPRTRGLSTYEKEYLAILITVDHWRSYLQWAEFVILNDQKSLIHLSDQRLHTHCQQKVFTKLIGLQYKTVYRKGSDNKVVDALSRHPDPPAELLGISSVQLDWLDKVQAGYEQDASSKQMLTTLSISPGVLRYKNRVWIGDSVPLQQQILT
jgi:hypothetical protein